MAPRAITTFEPGTEAAGSQRLTVYFPRFFRCIATSSEKFPKSWRAFKNFSGALTVLGPVLINNVLLWSKSGSEAHSRMT
jgi:hypothetical protein